MALISIKIDDDIIKDFDVVAKLNRRNRSVHIRELMMDEIKKEHVNNPDIFVELGDDD